MDLTISTLALEAFLLVVVRTACFVAVAPIFAHKSINARLRVLIAACISFTIYTAMDIGIPEYQSVFGYTFLLIKEAAVGLMIGFVSSMVMAILIFAGEFIDREIGFTMSTNFDPNTGAMVTISGDLYDKLVCLIIILTNLHHFILKAIAQSFVVVPVGEVKINFTFMYTNVLVFIAEYFSIGFRIAMPIFLAATMLNIILGVLAKSSPQMNMFAIGMQLKVLVGLFTFTITILYIPNIANYIMEKMQGMVMTVLGGL